jgi:acyl carrier protein
MNQNEITNRIRAVLAKELRVDPATIADTASQLDLPTWDSFCHVNVVFAVEEAFGIDFDEAEMRTAVSIPLLVAAVEKHLPASQSGQAD